MMSVTQLGYLGISAGDVRAWEQFATQILGLEVNGYERDGSLFLRMDEYHHRFCIHPTGKDDIAYIGWEVANEEVLQTVTEQLHAAGVEVQPGTPAEARARRVARLLRFVDPNGVTSELFYGPHIQFDKPFVSPRPISGFRTGELGMGHFALATDDLERSLHFYQSALSMRLTDFIHFELVPGVQAALAFLRCNPRHHSLALLTTPQRLPRRLRHVMLQVQALDEVGAAYALCREQKIPLAMDLGRHTNDHMVSFYIESPSGFMVEYGWGGREIDDSTWRVQTHSATSIWGHQRAEVK